MFMDESKVTLLSEGLAKFSIWVTTLTIACEKRMEDIAYNYNKDIHKDI
jgi:hypothetical protein